jgi:NAD(P)H-quinone oxidoreductase subunit 5
MVLALSGLTVLAHILPLDLHDAPDPILGLVALLGMAALHLCLAVLQRWPAALRVWRRWSFAGFFVDEIYTRMALRFWPTGWTPGRPSLRKVAAPN